MIWTKADALLSAKRLKEARTLNNMSLDQVSNLTKISKTALFRYEKDGLLSANIDKITNICNTLSVPFEWILGMDVDLEKSIENDPNNVSENFFVATASPKTIKDMQARIDIMKKIYILLSSIDTDGLNMIKSYTEFISSNPDYITDIRVFDSFISKDIDDELLKKYGDVEELIIK